MTTRARSSIRVNGPAASAAILLALQLGIAAASANSGVTIEKPWIRLIIKARPASGYFTLHNDTDKTITLTGAASAACGMVMLHQTKEENVIERMLPVKSITVKAHGTLRFAPGGYHIMCMKPQSSMVIGKSVPVTLKFADGKTLTAQFPVTGPGRMK